MAEKYIAMEDISIRSIHYRDMNIHVFVLFIVMKKDYLSSTKDVTLQ